MTKISYLSFDLLIDRVGGAFCARVLSSPVGQARHDFDLSSVERYFDQKGRRSGKLLTMFGGQLFEAVFGGEVLMAFRRSLDEAERQQAGLRILLRLGEVPELARLPWEYLRDESRQRFIGLSKKSSVTRYLALPEGEKALVVQSAVRILVVLSNPLDEPPLDVHLEWQNLQKALGKVVEEGRVVLDRLENGTFAALQSQLGKKTYHIVHFVGHGAFDDAEQTGLLLFEDAQGFSDRVPANHVANLLHDQPSLRLVLLNACKGARSSRSNPFVGMAASLIQQGMPAVIAMQFDITDQAAITFAHKFYQAIAENQPVDAAVTEGRRAIYYRPNELEWGTPVLYMRAPDGYIFDVQAPSAAPYAYPSGRMAPHVPLYALPPASNWRHQSGTMGSDVPLDRLWHQSATTASHVPVGSLAFSSWRGASLRENTPHSEERYLDAAMPKEVVVGQSTELVTLIRLPDSAGLRAFLKDQHELEANAEDVKSSQFELEFPRDQSGRPTNLDLWIDLETDDFEVPIRRKKIRVQPSKNSALGIFRLIPRKTGPLDLLIQVFIAGETLLASDFVKVQSVTTLHETARSIISVATLFLGSFSLRGAKERQTEGHPEQSEGSKSSGPLWSGMFFNKWEIGNSYRSYQPAFRPYQSPRQEIAQRLAERQLVLFVGADLPESITPSRQGLADELATEPAIFYQKIAQLIQLTQPKWIITSAYHRHLELALEHESLLFDTVVNDIQLRSLKPKSPTVLKLYGDTQQAEELMITEEDQSKGRADQATSKKSIIEQVGDLFRRYNVLFMGVDLRDPTFDLFLQKTVANRFPSGSYAVWGDISWQEIASLERRYGLNILPGEAVPFLDGLLEWIKK
ncbi:MAG: CHAT domain-containing protein [Ardenticatenaceae bacterium]